PSSTNPASAAARFAISSFITSSRSRGTADTTPTTSPCAVKLTTLSRPSKTSDVRSSKPGAMERDTNPSAPSAARVATPVSVTNTLQGGGPTTLVPRRHERFADAGSCSATRIFARYCRGQAGLSPRLRPTTQLRLETSRGSLLRLDGAMATAPRPLGGMAYAGDLKSSDRKIVSVRVRQGLPLRLRVKVAS